MQRGRGLGIKSSEGRGHQTVALVVEVLYLWLAPRFQDHLYECYNLIENEKFL